MALLVTSNMGSRKRKILTLEDRVKVARRLTSGESARFIAASLGVGMTQIQTIAKEKYDILRRWEAGENGERKCAKSRKCVYQDLDDTVWAWFCEARARNIPLSGPLIQEKATMLAATFGHSDLHASNGWLVRWKARHNVRLFRVER